MGGDRRATTTGARSPRKIARIRETGAFNAALGLLRPRPGARGIVRSPETLASGQRAGR